MHPSMITQTTIIPGEGIGNSIRLGQSMYSIMNKFNKFNHKLTISYSDKDYLNTPVVVTLPNLGIRLVFENSNIQRLILIEVINFKFLKLAYNGISLNDIIINQLDSFANNIDGDNDESNMDLNQTIMVPSNFTDNLMNKEEEGKIVKPPTLRLIYNKIFGPTYPGKLSKNFNSYILSYPGISFKFNIKSTDLIQKLKKVNDNENLVLSKLLNWDKSEDISCDSIAIFDGNSWDDFYSKFSKSATDNKLSSDNENIQLLLVNLKLGLIKLIFENDKEFIIKIGQTTQQEVLNILGPPDDYFNKFDSRLLIHNHLSNSLNIDDDTTNNSIYKFHNYFRYGLDFLYDLNDSSSSNKTGILKKIIIHNGGITESLDFMKWNKCSWEIFTGENSTSEDKFNEKEDIKVNSSMYFNEIPAEFFNKINSSTFDLRPVLLNRNESEFIDNDLDIINVNEVTNSNDVLFKQNSDSSSSINSNSKIKTWGQSKLYGCNRCIWEVIDSSGCISCVTIY